MSMKSKLTMFYAMASTFSDDFTRRDQPLTEEQLLVQRKRNNKKAKQVRERNYKRQGLTKFTFDGKEVWALNETSARIKHSKL